MDRKILGTTAVDSWSDCSFLSRLSRMRRHAAASDAAISLRLSTVQTLSPPVTSFRLVCFSLSKVVRTRKAFNIRISG
jgi:hypothetical protein